MTEAKEVCKNKLNDWRRTAPHLRRCKFLLREWPGLRICALHLMHCASPNRVTYFVTLPKQPNPTAMNSIFLRSIENIIKLRMTKVLIEDVMSINQICRKLQQHKKELRAYGVEKIAIFGSVVRHEEKPDSDIDILVDFDPTKGLFIFIDLKFYLETLLGRKVDLVTKNGLHPALKDKILKEAKNAF